MAFTLFYSWQSDSPPDVNRNFIEEALKRAIKEIGKDLNIEDAPRENIILDKDTKGVPGQPHIAEVILQKISECGIFVPDLTFIGKTEDGRLLMNPNVLIEYGWALNKPSRNKIVAVMNTAFGEPGEDLPFDIRHLRWPITYKLDEEFTPLERKEILDSLVRKLIPAIKTILESGILTESSESEPLKVVQYTTNPSTFLKEGEPLGKKGDQPLFLPKVQRLFLRIVPMQKIETLSSPKRALDLISSGNLPPMAPYEGWSSLRNKHGAFVYYSENGKVLVLTQLFLNGELWGIDALTIDKQRLMEHSGINVGFIPCIAFEKRFVKALELYLKFVNEILKLPLPLKIIAGATDIKDYKMNTTNRSQVLEGYVVNNDIVWEGEINDFNLKPTKILRPFFDYVWEECGLDRPDVESLN